MKVTHTVSGYLKSVQQILFTRSQRNLSLLASLLLMLSTTGCIMSSISDSISDSSKSSSGSSTSSSGESKESYLRDIKQYTVVYTRSNSSMLGFAKGLSAISYKHGVTDWEANTSTYVGIGEGFAKAAVSQQQLEGYIASLAQGNQLKVAAIQQGFRQGQ